MYVVINKSWDEAAPLVLFAVKRTLEWSKKYVEQRGVTFSETSWPLRRGVKWVKSKDLFGYPKWSNRNWRDGGL